MADSEQNKAVVRECYVAATAGDAARLSEILDPAFVIHTPEDYRGVEIVAYGHFNNAELDHDGWPRPRVIGATIGLDTIAHGVLTAMRLSDRRLFQSTRHNIS